MITDVEVNIVVSDEVIGIPKEEQEYLFERFFRAKNVTNIQGTGLGLNIVGKYLETMKGQIEFKSELGKGTTFNIKIPIQK
jgi:signal transduction histidine kinase